MWVTETGISTELSKYLAQMSHQRENTKDVVGGSRSLGAWVVFSYDTDKLCVKLRECRRVHTTVPYYPTRT
jgi:hypothetical protein